MDSYLNKRGSPNPLSQMAQNVAPHYGAYMMIIWTYHYEFYSLLQYILKFNLRRSGELFIPILQEVLYFTCRGGCLSPFCSGVWFHVGLILEDSINLFVQQKNFALHIFLFSRELRILYSNLSIENQNYHVKENLFIIFFRICKKSNLTMHSVKNQNNFICLWSFWRTKHTLCDYIYHWFFCCLGHWTKNKWKWRHWIFE